MILPELYPLEEPARFAESCRVIDRLAPGAENVPARLAALLLPLGEEGTRKALRRLKCSNALTEETAVLVREIGTSGPATDPAVSVRRLLGRYGLTAVERLAALGAAGHPEQAADFAARAELARQMEADGVCCRIAQLAVNGRDLMAAGAKPGPGLRQLLEQLLEAVIAGQVPNEKQALLAAAAQFSAS